MKMEKIVGTAGEIGVGYEFTEHKAICFAIASCFEDGEDFIAVQNYCEAVDITTSGDEVTIHLKGVIPRP